MTKQLMIVSVLLEAHLNIVKTVEKNKFNWVGRISYNENSGEYIAIEKVVKTLKSSPSGAKSETRLSFWSEGNSKVHWFNSFVNTTDKMMKLFESFSDTKAFLDDFQNWKSYDEVATFLRPYYINFQEHHANLSRLTSGFLTFIKGLITSNSPKGESGEFEDDGDDGVNNFKNSTELHDFWENNKLHFFNKFKAIRDKKILITIQNEEHFTKITNWDNLKNMLKEFEEMLNFFEYQIVEKKQSKKDLKQSLEAFAERLEMLLDNLKWLDVVKWCIPTNKIEDDNNGLYFTFSSYEGAKIGNRILFSNSKSNKWWNGKRAEWFPGEGTKTQSVWPLDLPQEK